MAKEFLDLVEGEYFENCLFSSFEDSFNRDLKNILIDNLTNSELYKDKERVAVPTLITYIYRLYKS